MHPNRLRLSFALLFLLAAGFSGCASLVQTGSSASTQNAPLTLSSGWQLMDTGRATESGEVISTPGYTPKNWYRATVPGTVLTSLVNDGVYPEPLYGENNRPNIIPDYLCRLSYWYRTQFTVPSEYAGQEVWLNFAGINYLAEVWVNGHKAGDIKGAFARGIFDVTSLVKAGETAVIAVKILPPLHPADPLEQTVALGLGPNGGILSKDGPTFICTQGWDWIPGIRDRDMGIWQKVTLSASGPVVLQDPYVVTHLPLPRTDSADVSIEVAVQNVSDLPQTGALAGTFGNFSFTSAAVTLAPKSTQTIKLTPANAPVLHLTHPRLWWPNGFGEPNLYALHLEFDVNEKPSDARDLNVGVREVTYSIPNSQYLTICVNGVPVFAKGGDWGMDEAMKREPRERLEAQIRYHREANYTIIRNWVGQSTSEDFYDLCDRYGIMIWDEFFEPNPSDSGRTNRNDGSEDVLDVPLYLANVREKVLRYRNHPSIALWCGRNEGDPAPAAVADGLAAIIKELNPDRLYHPNSNDGAGVKSGGPYAWRAPEAFYSGSGRNAPLEPFKTEIGSVSIPTIESIYGMMPKKDADALPPNDDWAEHDLARGADNGNTYPQTLATRYGAFNTLPDFVRKAQLANYEAFRAMYEGRFAKLFAPTSALITWMSNPAQPSTTWQIYSYDLEPFSSLFAVKKACEPIHVQMNQNDFHVMVINHLPAALASLHTRVRVYNLDGSLKLDQMTPVAAAPGSTATDADAINFPAEVSAVHFVKVELFDAQNKLLSDNFYWRGVSADDLTALDSLPTVNLTANIVRHDAGGKCILEVTLTNPAPTIALMAHLQLRREQSNQRVLPVHYSDNYISLLPGESKTISIAADSKDLAGEKPLVVLDGWNVNTAAQTFPGLDGGADFAPNTEAMVSHAAATAAN